jgi:hypothetical protein
LTEKQEFDLASRASFSISSSEKPRLLFYPSLHTLSKKKEPRLRKTKSKRAVCLFLSIKYVSGINESKIFEVLKSLTTNGYTIICPIFQYEVVKD